MGFPRTPFLTVAEDLPLYRQSQRQKPIWLLPLYLRSVHFQIFQVSCHLGGHLCALGLRGRVDALTAYASDEIL